MLFVQNVNGDQTAFKADNVQITDTLGQYPTLSFTFVETPENEVAAQMMIPFTIIEVPENKQRYRIVTNSPVSLGKVKQYSVTAIHIAKDLHNKYVDERLENTQSLKSCLDLLIKDTQIKYVLHDNFDNYAFSEGFGGGYADDLLMQNLANDFGFEFYFDNYTIHIQKKLGTKESFLFIDNANVSKISYNEDYSTITTYIKGQAKPIVQETSDETINNSETVEEDKPTEYEIHSEYVSPLVEKAHWPKVEAEPITDDNITDENTLINKLKASIHDYPDIEYTLDYANFKHNSVKFNNNIKIGNYGWLRDRFGIDVEVRINSYTWYPQSEQADTVTFGNKRFDPVEWQVRNQKAFERNKKLGETLKNQIAKVQGSMMSQDKWDSRFNEINNSFINSNKGILKQFEDINTRLDSIEKTGKEEGGSDETSEP